MGIEWLRRAAAPSLTVLGVLGRVGGVVDKKNPDVPLPRPGKEMFPMHLRRPWGQRGFPRNRGGADELPEFARPRATSHTARTRE